MVDIKHCLVCNGLMKETDYKIKRHFEMAKFCSVVCSSIFRDVKRQNMNIEDFKRGLGKGLLFEKYVSKILNKKGFITTLSNKSLGIFDIVAFKNDEVFGIEVTTNKSSKNEDYLIEKFSKFNKINPSVKLMLIAFVKLKLHVFRFKENNFKKVDEWEIK